MFAKTIIDSDAFIDMPLSAQALYFHLSMRGDDEGFINNPKRIQRMIGASDDDLKLLIAKRFIIPFDSGIVVIKHWKIHNYIRGDRKVDTVYQDEKRLLLEKENGAYTLASDVCEDDVCQMTGRCQTNVRQVTGKCQHRIVEDSIVQYSTVEDNVMDNSPANVSNKRFKPPTLEEVQAYCDERGNSVDAQRFIDYYTANGWKVGKNSMKDWKAAVRTWERSATQNKSSGNPFLDMLGE